MLLPLKDGYKLCYTSVTKVARDTPECKVLKNKDGSNSGRVKDLSAITRPSSASKKLTSSDNSSLVNSMCKNLGSKPAASGQHESNECGCYKPWKPRKPHNSHIGFLKFTTNWQWDKLQIRNEFLLCMGLKMGAILIGVFGSLTGIISLCLFLGFLIKITKYINIYAAKVDVLIFLIYESIIISMILVASIFLLQGIKGKSEKCLKIYLWIMWAHLIASVLVVPTTAVYCVIEVKCFQGTGFPIAIVFAVITFFYFAFWWYMMMTVNSYREVYYDNGVLRVFERPGNKVSRKGQERASHVSKPVKKGAPSFFGRPPPPPSW